MDMEPERQGTTSATVQVPCSLWVTRRDLRPADRGLLIAKPPTEDPLAGTAGREQQAASSTGARDTNRRRSSRPLRDGPGPMSQHSGCHQRTRTLSGSAPACFALLKWLAPGATKPFPWPAQTASLANPRSHPCLTLIDMAQLRLCGFVPDTIMMARCSF